MVIGASPTATLSVPTPANLVPGRARNVQAYPKSQTEISISWQEPSVTNGLITGYELIYFSTMDTASKILICFIINSNFSNSENEKYEEIFIKATVKSFCMIF